MWNYSSKPAARLALQSKVFQRITSCKWHIKQTLATASSMQQDTQYSFAHHCNLSCTDVWKLLLDNQSYCKAFRLQLVIDSRMVACRKDSSSHPWHNYETFRRVKHAIVGLLGSVDIQIHCLTSSNDTTQTPTLLHENNLHPLRRTYMLQGERQRSLPQQWPSCNLCRCTCQASGSNRQSTTLHAP